MSKVHTTQLALLCNLNDEEKNTRKFEQVGVYIEPLGDCLKGTVNSVAADNRSAHGLAGFNESVRSIHFCRFCLATQTDMQTSDAVTGC